MIFEFKFRTVSWVLPLPDRNPTKGKTHGAEHPHPSGETTPQNRTGKQQN
jgi:hypothetical protein